MTYNEYNEHKVDTGDAIAFNKFVLEWLQYHPAEILKAMSESINFRDSLLLAAVTSGLVADGSPKLAAFESFITIAFSTGFYYGTLALENNSEREKDFGEWKKMQLAKEVNKEHE